MCVHCKIMSFFCLQNSHIVEKRLSINKIYHIMTRLVVGDKHYSDVIMDSIVSQITSLTIVYSSVYSGADKKKSKIHVTGLCAWNSPVTGEFPAQRASNAENVSI